MTTRSDLYIDQGSDFSAIVSLRNQDGTPINLTNFTVKSQFRKSYQSSFATDFTVSVIEPLLGKIRIKLPADASSAIHAGRYLYDVEITTINILNETERKRVLEGLVIISPEITRV